MTPSALRTLIEPVRGGELLWPALAAFCCVRSTSCLVRSSGRCTRAVQADVAERVQGAKERARRSPGAGRAHRRRVRDLHGLPRRRRGAPHDGARVADARGGTNVDLHARRHGRVGRRPRCRGPIREGTKRGDACCCPRCWCRFCEPGGALTSAHGGPRLSRAGAAPGRVSARQGHLVSLHPAGRRGPPRSFANYRVWSTRPPTRSVESSA